MTLGISMIILLALCHSAIMHRVTTHPDGEISTMKLRTALGPIAAHNLSQLSNPFRQNTCGSQNPPPINNTAR
jgi:hypothetical protein